MTDPDRNWTEEPVCPDCGSEFERNVIEAIEDGNWPEVECSVCGAKHQIMAATVKTFLVLPPDSVLEGESMVDRCCGNCRHWDPRRSDSGNCAPPLPFWLDEMLTEKAQIRETYRWHGRECAVFDEYQEPDDASCVTPGVERKACGIEVT